MACGRADVGHDDGSVLRTWSISSNTLSVIFLNYIIHIVLDNVFNMVLRTYKYVKPVKYLSDRECQCVSNRVFMCVFISLATF